jgi:hypothetical protein
MNEHERFKMDANVTNKETVRKITYRDSRCLALALRA